MFKQSKTGNSRGVGGLESRNHPWRRYGLFLEPHIGTEFNLKFLNYYSHETERTQWDHPEMVSLMEEIGK